MTKSSGEIKKAAADITAGATTPEEKTSEDLQFCQTQFKNTTFDTNASPTRTGESCRRSIRFPTF
jgi:hypothetical protein